MSADSIHSTRQAIHSTLNADDLVNSLFVEKLSSYLQSFPIDNSQNYHAYVKALQEYNKKLYNLGLGDQIVQPVDAGFRPLNLEASLSTSGNDEFTYTFSFKLAGEGYPYSVPVQLK